MKHTRKIILASTSPRRRELLGKLGLSFVVKPGDYEEDMTLKLSPHKLAMTLSAGKARAVAKGERNSLVIAADTFVVLGHDLLGKPKSAKEAKSMLRRLSGRRVDILTGLTMIDTKTNKRVSKVATTRVFFKRFSEKEISLYVASGEPMDKAGAFAIQGLGAALIKRIEGDFLAAMGLPLFVLAAELKKFGVEVL